MSHDVFISYSSKDKAAADAACAVLERKGIRVWIAPRDILPGVGWAQSIIAAINGARIMVLIFSSNANSSPQIEREVERAIHKAIPVVPFRLEDVTPSEALEYYISTPHWLDAYTPPMEAHLERLANAVKQLLASDLLRREQDTDFRVRSSAGEILPVTLPVAPEPAPAPPPMPAAPEPPTPEPETAEPKVAKPPELVELLKPDPVHKAEQVDLPPAPPRPDPSKAAPMPETRQLELPALPTPLPKPRGGYWPVYLGLAVVVVGLGIAFIALNHARDATLASPAQQTPPSTPSSPTVTQTPSDPSMSADALFAKGSDYFYARGVSRDYAAAMVWYRKAAEFGNAPAQTNIGYMYQMGLGVDPDYAQAVIWNHKAADQNYAIAQYNLGYLYEHGFGVTQDYAQAIDWYLKAAKQNYIDAQYNLARLYEKGLGTSKNIDEALFWYGKAADQGDSQSKDAVERLSNSK